MLVSDIKRKVKRQFGDESGVQVTDADIIGWINDGLKEIAKKNNVLETKSSSNLVAGVSEYTLPSDTLTLHSVRVNGQRVRGLSLPESDEYVYANSSTPTGTPIVFWVYAGKINFYPTPDTNSTGSLVLYYTRQPAAVASDTDVIDMPTGYDNQVVAYCLQQAYEMDENFDAANVKGSQFKDGLGELLEAGTYTTRESYPRITVLLEDL